ncbi:MAG TPA: LysM peptidoglycan-binding domain-containing protein [Rickettsiales bacterium]|nr:LysM peptidoglycan-binding domain-containing protein [Rickettsiales bacterium]
MSEKNSDLGKFIDSAFLSKTVYRKDLKQGLKVSDKWSVTATSKELLSRDKTGYFGAIFQDNEGNKIIASRGTDIKDKHDIKADLQIGLNILPTQLDSAINFIEEATSLNKISNTTNILEIGHSLGGALAEFLSIKYNSRADAFNAPGIKALINNFEKKFNVEVDIGNLKNTISNINSTEDIVSKFGTQVGTIYELEYSNITEISLLFSLLKNGVGVISIGIGLYALYQEHSIDNQYDTILKIYNLNKDVSLNSIETSKIAMNVLDILNPRVYLTTAGQTLSEVAMDFNIPVDKILKLNSNLNLRQTLFEGTKINLPNDNYSFNNVIINQNNMETKISLTDKL